MSSLRHSTLPSILPVSASAIVFSHSPSHTRTPSSRFTRSRIGHSKETEDNSSLTGTTKVSYNLGSLQHRARRSSRRFRKVQKPTKMPRSTRTCWRFSESSKMKIPKLLELLPPSAQLLSSPQLPPPLSLRPGRSLLFRSNRCRKSVRLQLPLLLVPPKMFDRKRSPLQISFRPDLLHL